MYRQILVNDSDRLYQHILWRNSEEDRVEEFELSTVTYGLKSSPFLALRVIRQLVQDEGHPYPLASRALSEDIYVDDIVTGASTDSDLLLLKDQLIQLLSKGCFSLSKWATNCPDLLGPLNNTQSLSLCNNDDPIVKILGLHWESKPDVFSYALQLTSPSFTKRGILSTIARCYDPLGYLSPVIFLAKRILQETWKLGIGWDELVPDKIQKAWKDFVEDMPNITNIKIPRYLLLDNCESQCSLFGFCDASQAGYCAAFYLKVSNRSQNSIFLIKAKTKLAPIKPMTIPRLELCAALLLTSLYVSLSNFRKHLNIITVRLFTDSSIVLSWLKTPSHILKTFVAHRIIRILESTELNWWQHISTQHNPADCGSRGMLPSQLIEHRLWWAGPSWIYQSENNWKSLPINIAVQELPEIKTDSLSLVITSIPPNVVNWMERFSTLTTLIRSMAYIYRFVAFLKTKIMRVGPISAAEFKSARQLCILILQKFYYPEAFQESGKLSNLLLSLHVKKDQDGILRVGGRLEHSGLSEHQKHPILLPRRSHFTTLLVDYYHRSHLHAGISAVHAAVQRCYWIPAARSLIKQRKRKCLVCYKSSKIQNTPFMGNIPASRFVEVRAFVNCGVDFAGPFLCRVSLRRRASTVKAYLCLFVCFSTKAVHLESVPALSTPAFLDALDRFISRRGKPSKIISDRGSNFIGASRYLREVQSWFQNPSLQQDIVNHLSHQDIEWSFNPPNAPHFGGLWEAGVKSVKSLLHKLIGSHPFTFDELSTMFAKIEAILNSRPLVPLSSDPADLDPLTPGHFLIGGPLSAAPELDLTNEPPNRLNRWQLLRERTQSFWNRWKTEYLHTLQQRQKWIKPTINLKEGDLVLIKDTQTHPLKWPLARIVKVHPGEDNVVRVATIRTATNIYQRPVIKLVPLMPITSSDQDITP